MWGWKQDVSAILGSLLADIPGHSLTPAPELSPGVLETQKLQLSQSVFGT